MFGPVRARGQDRERILGPAIGGGKHVLGLFEPLDSIKGSGRGRGLELRLPAARLTPLRSTSAVSCFADKNLVGKRKLFLILWLWLLATLCLSLEERA